MKNKDFIKPSFIVAMSMFLLMGIFVLIGNPRITSDNAMCWHHIPELIGLYFVGFWTYEVKMKFTFVFLMYIFGVLMTPIFSGVFNPFIFVLGGIIGFPLLLGYCIKKWEG